MVYPPVDESDDEPTTAGGADDGSPGSGRRPRTPMELYADTGLTPEEFVLEEIRDADGPLKQQELCRASRLSDSTVSGLLSRMEQAGTVTRIRIGAEKIVYLPDSPPAIVPSLKAKDDLR